MANTIWLASYPRSGNTWFRILWHQLTGLPTTSVHYDGYRTKNAIKEIGSLAPKVTVIDTEEFEGSLLTKTHHAPPGAGNPFPAILLIRDVRDVAVSYYHYLKEIDGYKVPDVELLDRIATGRIMFGSWQDHMWQWLCGRMRGPEIVWTFNEILRLGPVEIIKRTVEALGLDIPLRPCKIPSFAELSERDPAFFRRGTHRQYVDYPDLTSLIEEHQAGGLEMWDKLRKVPAEARGSLFRR